MDIFLPKYLTAIFEVLTGVNMTMLFFWVVTPCGLVGRYKHFGETYNILKMETVCFSETLVFIYESTRRHNPEEQHRQSI
jgi:hypothetical protein